MERYNKYLVLKLDDIQKHLTDEQQQKLDLLTTKIRLGRLREGKLDQQYVVVAADWPMYETTWKMVEAFVDGKPDELAALQAENEKLREDAERVLNSARAFLNCDELRSCVKLRATSEYVDLFNSVNNSTIDAARKGE